MQIYLLALFLIVLAAVQVYIVRSVIVRRRRGEPWVSLGRYEPPVAPPLAASPAAAVSAVAAANVDPAGPAPLPRRPRAGLGQGVAAPGQTPGRAADPVPAPRPTAPPEFPAGGATMGAIEGRLTWAFDLLKSGKISLESYVRIAEAERDGVAIKLAQLRDGIKHTDDAAELELAQGAIARCLDWARTSARHAA